MIINRVIDTNWWLIKPKYHATKQLQIIYAVYEGDDDDGIPRIFDPDNSVDDLRKKDKPKCVGNEEEDENMDYVVIPGNDENDSEGDSIPRANFR